VIYAEDYNFYRHNGVDWDAIEHAVAADWNKGAMAIGGSTITQQLAKNLYLSPRRSMFRKMREVLIAYALEDHLSKQRILELYLNIVEWGDGVFGAEAAARMWFHHSAQNLTAAEAIRLAIALPNPIARAPNVHDAELTRKAVRVVRLLRMQGLLDASQERATLDELGASSERVLPDREVREIRGVAAPTAGEPAPEAQAPSDRRPPSTAESTSTNGEPASAPPATEPSAPPATEPVTPPDQAAPAPIAHPAQSPAPPEPPPASAELPPPVAGGSSAP
jgi:monofunctional biosynthetic peptidoglycan transglycosylase